MLLFCYLHEAPHTLHEHVITIPLLSVSTKAREQVHSEHPARPPLRMILIIDIRRVHYTEQELGIIIKLNLHCSAISALNIKAIYCSLSVTVCPSGNPLLSSSGLKEAKHWLFTKIFISYSTVQGCQSSARYTAVCHWVMSGLLHNCYQIVTRALLCAWGFLHACILLT